MYIRYCSGLTKKVLITTVVKSSPENQHLLFASQILIAPCCAVPNPAEHFWSAAQRLYFAARAGLLYRFPFILFSFASGSRRTSHHITLYSSSSSTTAVHPPRPPEKRISIRAKNDEKAARLHRTYYMVPYYYSYVRSLWGKCGRFTPLD